MTNQYETQLFFKPPPRSNLLHANSCLTFNPVECMLNGHRLDKKVRRFNKLKSDLEDYLMNAKLSLVDPEEKDLWDIISEAIEYADVVSSREDERLNMFI